MSGLLDIAELLAPADDPPHLAPLLRQVGITKIVTLLEDGEQRRRWLRAGEPATAGQGERPLPPRGERCWELPALTALQRRYRDQGFEVAVIEDFPPLDEARLGGQGRDEQISNFIDQVRAMGQLGIPVLCYNWMAISSWARTDVAYPLRGGSLSTAFRNSDAAQDQVNPGEITDELLWDNLTYFLRAVVPVAEASGVRLALHPDDPPRASVRGVPHIIRSVQAYRRVLDIVPSVHNGITLCQGNFRLMTDDIPAVIRELGARGVIHFVHLRDVAGDVDDFFETWHDEGPTDLFACLAAYRDAGVRGVLRPDHVPAMHGEENPKPGYSVLGRLFAVGYIRGLLHALERGAAA
ncbi:MAG: mannonate dehydratase [Candidatus Dormibacteria bacterium]